MSQSGNPRKKNQGTSPLLFWGIVAVIVIVAGGLFWKMTHSDQDTAPAAAVSTPASK